MDQNFVSQPVVKSESDNPDINEEIVSLDSVLPQASKADKKRKLFLVGGGLFLLLVSLVAGIYLIKNKREEVRVKAGTGSECFDPPLVYRPAPYTYYVGATHSPGSEDWVVYPIKEACANKERLEQIFGPLDRVFPDKEVYITRPNQPFQYGFTFNRIMHIDGYDDSQVQEGLIELSEQQLHDLHYQGKDTQSIRDCDENGRQVVFDLTGESPYGKVAKPNGWVAREPGYYQFDLTPRFQCEGGALHQNSLGAGFIRVVRGAFCSIVRVYNSSWEVLEQSQLSNLKPGDQIYLAVLGEGEGIDKARFRINSGNWIETEEKRPNTGEFYIAFTIPEGVADFNIEAEIHHPDQGWK